MFLLKRVSHDLVDIFRGKRNYAEGEILIARQMLRQGHLLLKRLVSTFIRVESEH